MAKKATKKSPPKMPLVTITIRGAAGHNRATRDAIHGWVALKMLEYHQDHEEFSYVCTMRYFRNE